MDMLNEGSEMGAGFIQEAANHITSAWMNMIVARAAGIIEVGELLIRLREEMGTDWKRMFRDGYPSIERPIQMSVKKARLIMQFADDPYIRVGSWYHPEVVMRLAEMIEEIDEA